MSGHAVHLVLAVLVGLVLAYGAFLLGSLLLYFVAVRLIDGLDRPEGFRDHWPLRVRLFVPVLMVAWVVGGVAYGYDSAQWLWTGVSVLAATVVILVVTVRRSRPTADGQHRGRR